MEESFPIKEEKSKFIPFFLSFALYEEFFDFSELMSWQTLDYDFRQKQEQLNYVNYISHTFNES